MGKILGTWRALPLTTFMFILPIGAYTLMHHPDFESLAQGARAVLGGIENEAIQIAKKCKKKLIIAGIIQDMAYFEMKVKPYINDDICYVGSADSGKRDKLLGNASALLHPINFAEPFGLSVVESFACGTPVIAFDKGSMSEIILDGKNGYLVSTIDEAVSAVKNITHINRMFCRKDAEQRFTSQRMVQDYIKVYQMILKNVKKTGVY